MALIIETYEEGSGHTCIDGSHVVHYNGRGYSVLHLKMGMGDMMSASNKLGLATASSVEMKVVSAGENFPKCAWFRFFRMAQGCVVKEDALMKNNKSCILFKRTIHILLEKVLNTHTSGICLWWMAFSKER